MAGKQTKKLRQLYRREIRDELQHVEAVKREEKQILNEHILHCVQRKPKLLPKWLWRKIVVKVLYR